MGLYTVEMVDPPPGWDDKMIEVRHRKIPVEQIGIACSVLLSVSRALWLKAGKPGKAAPTVRVLAHDLSSLLQ